MATIESQPTTSRAPAVSTDSPLARRLGLRSAATLTVGVIIGSGIFRTPAPIATEVHSALAMSLVWIAGGALALCGSLSLAELAAMYPQPGGTYVFLRETYGPLPAFLFGWISLFIQPAGVGAIALVFAEYANTFVALGPTGTRVLAAIVVIIVGAAGYRSVTLASGVLNVATWAKVAAMVALVVVVFALGNPSHGAFSGPGVPTRWSGFGIGLIAALWAYNGWQDPAQMVGEVRDPGRIFPRALIIGVSTVVALYLALTFTYMYVLPMATIARSPLVAADAMRDVLGEGATDAVAAMVMVSTFGATCAVCLSAPRIFFAMADDRLFFRGIAAVHPRYGTPYTAVTFTAVIAIVGLWFRSYEQLIEAFVVGIWPFLAMAVVAVPILRRRRPDFPRPFLTPGYPFVPILFAIASVLLYASALVMHTMSTLASIAVTLAGVPVFLYWRRSAASSAEPVPTS